MFIFTFKFDRKKAIFAGIMAILVIIGMVLLIRVGAGAVKTAGKADLSEEAGRIKYLASCGWQVQSPAESEAEILIPREFSKVYTKYNELQLQQGFDLRSHAGEKATVYTYRVTNWEDSDAVVYAQLYVQSGRPIGGDVHSTELDGFIVGLEREKAD